MGVTVYEPRTEAIGASAREDFDLLSGPAWGRHPTDVARAVVAAIVLAITLLLCLQHPTEVRSVSVDVVRLVNQLPSWFRTTLIGLTQLGMVASSIAVALVLVRRDKRLLFLGLIAAAAAGGAMAGMQGWLDEVVPHRVLLVNLQTSWLVGAAFPSGAFLVAYVAATVVLGPSTTEGWRRVLTVTIVLAAVLRVLTAVAVPLNVAVTLSVGYSLGSLALAIAGSPRRAVSGREVLAALAAVGIESTELRAVSLGASHSKTFLAETEDGREKLVKLAGRDERDAYLIHRFLRTLRVKGLEDTRTRWSTSDGSRHEALTSLLLRRNGASVSDVVAVTETEGGDGLVVMEPARGRRLVDVPAELLTDEVLDQVWQQVLILRRAGIAHRWLDPRHILLEVPGITDELAWEPRKAATDRLIGPPDSPAAGDATVTIIDLRWAVHSAEEHQLAADLAMLITGLALIVGAERSVGAAARVLDAGELASALPLVQPLAMPATIQEDLDSRSSVLAAVRNQLQLRSDGEPYELLDLQRIKASHAAGLIGFVAIAYTALSFAANGSHIARSLGQVSPAALPELIFLGLVPFVIGAGVLVSVVDRPLPFGQVVQLMFGQSFLNRFTPANAGGMALRVRYLQVRGVDLGSAAAAIGLSSLASGVGTFVTLGIFVIWSGSDRDGVTFTLPDASQMAVGLLVLLSLAGLIWLTPWGRRVVARRVETTIGQVLGALRQLLTKPGRFVNLFGLTMLGKLVTIFTFTESARAMGITVSFATLGLLYLTGSTVASTAPTPGGVGAVEAGLAAALTGVGVDAAQALSTVFLFRLISYWLPVPLGYAALRRIRPLLLDGAEPTTAR